MIKRKSWDIREEQLVEELMSLLQITPEECRLLKDLQPDASRISLKLVDDYYARLLQHEETREYITDLDALKQTLAQWFTSLFCGNYDKHYALERLRIGMAHVRIGLPVRYPLAMFAILTHYGELVTRKNGTEATEAFRKVLALDIATFTQSYDNAQLSHLTNLVGESEILARRLLSDEF